MGNISSRPPSFRPSSASSSSSASGKGSSALQSPGVTDVLSALNIAPQSVVKVVTKSVDTMGAAQFAVVGSGTLEKLKKEFETMPLMQHEDLMHLAESLGMSKNAVVKEMRDGGRVVIGEAISTLEEEEEEEG